MQVKYSFYITHHLYQRCTLHIHYIFICKANPYIAHHTKTIRHVVVVADTGSQITYIDPQCILSRRIYQVVLRCCQTNETNGPKDKKLNSM